MSDLYSIIDVERYVTGVREAAAKSLAENYNENLDEYISIKQATSIVSKESVTLDEEGRFVLDENANEKIFETIRTWIYNVGLAKLAGEDQIECAWDNSCNEMVFWVKSKPQKNK